VLTARQQEIWNFLVEYVDRQGYPPTVREIGEQVGLDSPSTVHTHLANLSVPDGCVARRSPAPSS
jgi:repressor LexA